MIVDNLTKLNQKKKLWMTPKHPLYTKEMSYKILYGAAVFVQAEQDCLSNPLNNFELERLLISGFGMKSDDMAKVLRSSKEKKRISDFLNGLTDEREKYLLLLDMFQVSIREGKISEVQKTAIDEMARRLWIEKDKAVLLAEFAMAASTENVMVCRDILHRMHLNKMDLSMVDMKYYIMQLWETLECTQDMLETQRDVRIVDRCQIVQDLVLYKGMRLTFDHAEVRIHGNIMLAGGELVVENSKIIRKSDSHRACVNIKSVYSKMTMKDSEADCRNFGMLVRAEAGSIVMENSDIYHTARGAAIRFWGNAIEITNCTFADCYSPEDGGALMIRTPNGIVRNCRFRNCEARRGGAVYAVEGNRITDCTFEKCCVAEFGAAVFYNGFVRANVRHLRYQACCPEGSETVQYIGKMGTFQVLGEYRIVVSTIIDCPVLIEAEGSLAVENAELCLNYPIRCRGSLRLDRVKLYSNHLERGDMIILEHSKRCEIVQSELNGMGKTGGLSAAGCRITVSQTVFRNMAGGRAIYDAYAPEITDCIFNFCQDGAVYSQDGTIRKSTFVNCRSKNGAGILMYGNRGRIEECRFRRCIADYSGGAIDRSLGQRVHGCYFVECKPNDVG